MALEAKIQELQTEQGKGIEFRKRTEVLLDAVEQESAMGGGSTSRAVQEILSRSPEQQAFADKIIADRELAESREAAL